MGNEALCPGPGQQQVTITERRKIKALKEPITTTDGAKIKAPKRPKMRYNIRPSEANLDAWAMSDEEFVTLEEKKEVQALQMAAT